MQYINEGIGTKQGPNSIGRGVSHHAYAKKVHFNIFYLAQIKQLKGANTQPCVS